MTNSKNKTNQSQSTFAHRYRAQYNRYSKNWTAYGRFMYNLTYNWGRFLNRRAFRWLAHLLNWTWGIVTALIGTILFILAALAGFTPANWHGLVYFKMYPAWGGFEMGPFFFRDITSSEDAINNHEWGHCFAQTTLLGPFVLFLVSIPSATRYWIHNYRTKHNKKNPAYDNIWFEACATDIGNDCIFDRRVEKQDYAIYNEIIK